MASAQRVSPNAILPQQGPQSVFLATPADIAVYGGAAGAGKTWAIQAEPLRHRATKGFGAVIFRRTYAEITNQGGLWDTSFDLYVPCGGIPKESKLQWSFPPYGNKISFRHMQHEKDRYDYQGAQIPLIEFDQLEHFTWRQFTYMYSRMRSVSAVRPYMRATCNPHPDHWLRRFMAWWIDDETGLPITERAGVIRWFTIVNNEVQWAASAAELVTRFGPDTQPKSFTFVPGKLQDNRILMDADPGYEANLQAMPYVERERLLGGNWNVRDSAGTIFRREWFEVVDAAPSCISVIRYWDRAGTASINGQTVLGASWTAGVKLGLTASGIWYVLDVVRFQGSPLAVERAIVNTASQDGHMVQVGIEQDPAQAGKAEANVHVRNLAGYDVAVNTVREHKAKRSKPVSSQAEAGNIKVVRAKWTDAYLHELENFDGTDKCVSDQTDATSGAFYMLTRPRKRAGTW